MRRLLASGLSIILASIILAMPAEGVASNPSARAIHSKAVSSAASSLIAGYYESILGRAPDAAGQAFWEGESERVQGLGADLNEVWRAMAIAFFESPEYVGSGATDAEFVSDLYAAFFRRAADRAGLDYWTSQLAAGLPRPAVMLWFLFSQEFDAYTHELFGDTPSRAAVDLVMDFYRGLLGRLPDTDGLGYWNERLRGAQCSGAAAVTTEVEALSSQFLASSEYQSRRRGDAEYITDLYNAFMRRGADLDGVRFWLGEIGRGARTREDLRRAFRDSPEFQARVAAVVREGCITIAQASNLAAGVPQKGPSPFIAFVDLRGLGLVHAYWVRFTVQAKPGAASRPVRVGFSRGYLERAGYSSSGALRVPVFGLYAGAVNNVTLEALFVDGSSTTLAMTIPTDAFVDPLGIFDHGTRLVARAQGSELGFDYFFAKPLNALPVILDTDGEVRWWMAGQGSSFSSTFVDGAFLLGDQDSLALSSVSLDGRTGNLMLAGRYTAFHHNFDRGKYGLLVEVDDESTQPINTEAILVEMALDGTVLREWDLAQIIGEHMRAGGDSPDGFVRPGEDWFHMNAATYDRRDDSIIVSSRENFVVKLDYTSGRILWILGDPTKYWYQFRSLRSKALALAPGGLYPIGQHAVSIRSDGSLMLFNNGVASLNLSPGLPRGESRNYSAVSAYTIDPFAFTAREVYRFDYGQSLFSQFCSGAYEAAGRSLLVAYSFVGTESRLVGLDGQGRVAFDFRYPTRGCATSFNAEPIALDDLAFN